MIHYFDRPVTVETETPGCAMAIGSTEEASEFLIRHWPKVHTVSHREALQACINAAEGRIKVSKARKAFAEAAKDAGIYAFGRQGGPERPADGANRV